MKSAILASLLLLLQSLAVARAPPATRPAEPGSEMRVFVLTMGPGDEAYEKFGHNAIRVIDESETGDYHDVAYNWGTFDFDSGFVHFAWNFVQGKLLYSMVAQKGAETVQFYKKVQNRSVYQQELNLSPAQKAQLREELRWTNTDPHRNYRYDYYRDNCSTRVRDVVNGLTGGRLKDMTKDAPSNTTFRWHTRRLITQAVWLYVALQGVLGDPVDQPISRWDEMFLPMALHDQLKYVMVPDPDGSGKLVPLVKEELILYQSDRLASPSRPPTVVPWFGLTGIVYATILLGLGHFIRRRRLAKWSFVIVVLPWLLLIGLGGLVLVWAWCCTDHIVVRHNENVLHVSPLMLPVIVLLPMVVLGSRRAMQPTRWIMVTIVGLSAIGILLKITPWFYQVNWDIIALTFPINVALAFITWKLAEHPPAAPGKRASRRRGFEPKGKAAIEKSGNS